MTVQPKSKIKNIAIFLILNIMIISYIEFGISDEDRYQDALIAFQDSNYFKTYNLMNRLAENEYPGSEYILATLYDKGLGVDADKKLAEFWYEKAAKKDNAAAKEFLRNQGIVETENAEYIP